MKGEERNQGLESLFQRHGADVHAYAAKRGVSKTEADDIVQESFLVCWRHLDDVPADALPWLLGTARRICASHWRSEHRRSALLGRMLAIGSWASPAPDPSEALVVRDELRLRLALASLPDHDREALMLVTWDGLTQEQGARLLGVSRKCFSRRVGNARFQLADHVHITKQREDEESGDGRRAGR